MSRKEIREALATLLAPTGLTVYSNRTESYFTSELPCLSIVSGEESVTRRDVTSKSFIRDLEMSIVLHAEATTELDDYLEDKIEEIESLLLSNQSLGVSGVLVMEITGNRIELESNSSNTTIGVAFINLRIKYVR